MNLLLREAVELGGCIVFRGENWRNPEDSITSSFKVWQKQKYNFQLYLQNSKVYRNLKLIDFQIFSQGDYKMSWASVMSLAMYNRFPWLGDLIEREQMNQNNVGFWSIPLAMYLSVPQWFYFCNTVES